MIRHYCFTKDGSWEGATTSGWGTRIGTEDDKEVLRDIIYAELKSLKIMVTLFTFVDVFFGIVILYPGLEEELAEAIDKNFYDSYKTWTLDNPKAPTTSQKVSVFQMKQNLELIFRFATG